MSLAAALDALDHDAKLWHETSDTLKRCSESVPSIHVSMSDSSIVGELTGFNSTYAVVQWQVYSLLKEGEQATEQMSSTMNYIHELFHANDAAAAARLKGQWEVRD